MKNGPSIPGWAIGLVLAIFVVALIGIGYKYVMGGGPLSESQYPKEAFKPPAYTPAAGTYTRDGKPVGGRPDAGGQAPAGNGPGAGNPYGGAYGQRPN